MPRGGNTRLEESDLRAKIKELNDRIEQMRRRKKAVNELKAWLEKRHLTPSDVLLMYREMKPKRADAPVRSKLPLVPKKQFGAAIRKARLAKNLTTNQLAEIINTSVPSLSNWERGANYPTEDARVRLMKALDLPLDYGKPPAPVAAVPNGVDRLSKALKSKAGKYLVGPGRTYKGETKKIRYVSDTGYVWGGLGRVPTWYTHHLKGGGTPEQLAVAHG